MNMLKQSIRYVFGIKSPDLRVLLNGTPAPEICSLFYSFTDSKRIEGSMQLCDNYHADSLTSRILPGPRNKLSVQYVSNGTSKASLEMTGVNFTSRENRAMLTDTNIAERLIFTAKALVNTNVKMSK